MRYIIFLLFFMLTSSISEATTECHIVYGLFNDYEPHEWIDEKGVARGINVDIMKAVANEANCSLEIVSYEWNTMLDMLKRGSITIVSASLNPSREDYAFQLPPNSVLYRYFFTRKDSQNIDNFEDARNKCILVQESSVADDHISSQAEEKNITVLRYRDKFDVIEHLSKGVGDAALLTIEGAENVFAQLGTNNNIKMSSQPLIPTLYGFIMNKNDFAVYQKLHGAMERLKFDGIYYDIIKKWRKNEDYGTLLKVFSTFAIILIATMLVIILWNTQLQTLVRRKTEQNSKLRDEALMASRMSALGEMASNVAHEINNPTGLIIHNIDFIQKVNFELLQSVLSKSDVLDNIKVLGSDWKTIYPEYIDSFKTINDNLLRIASCINDLKDYSTDRIQEKELVDLRKTIELAIKFTTFFIKKHTNCFSFEVDGDDFQIYGHAMHIEQVIINVIQNACYALTSIDQEVKCVLKKADNDYILISIKDSGKGMSKEILNNILTPFFTTRKDIGGTGLGLSITSRIIEEHNGIMNIESTKGVGTTVNIFIPYKK